MTGISSQGSYEKQQYFTTKIVARMMEANKDFMVLEDTLASSRANVTDARLAKSSYEETVGHKCVSLAKVHINCIPRIAGCRLQTSRESGLRC